MSAPILNITSLSQNQAAATNTLPYYEATTAVFVVPAVASEAALTVGNSTRYAIGGYVWVQGAGWFEVTGRPSATSLYLKNNGTGGNETPGTVAPIGSSILPAPPPVTVSAAAATLYDTLAQTFTIPSGANPAYLYLTTGGWPVANMYIFVHTAGWFKVTGYESTSKRCTVINADDQNAGSGNTVAAGAAVYPDFPRTPSLGGTYLERTASSTLWGDTLDGKATIPLMLGSSAVRLVRGVHTTVAASDTVATGLTAVIAILATLADDPATGEAEFVTASVGDQAGLPAAGSVYIKTWELAEAGPNTLAPATTFGKKINYLAIGT